MKHASEPYEIPPAPDSISELQADAKGKKKRLLLILFVAIPLAVLAIGGAAWYFGEKAARDDLKAAFSEASGCLLGAPLGEGERASRRARAVQLGAVHLERDRKADTRWPNRCADSVAALHEALRKHGRDEGGSEGLAARSELLAVALRKAEVLSDLSLEIDGLFEAAAAMGLAAEPVSLQIPTPEPAAALDLDSLPESARITPLQYTLDNVSSTPMVDGDIHAMVYDKKVSDIPLLCVFTAEGKDRCRALGGAMKGKSGLVLGGTVDSGASPLLFAGRSGDDGIHRSDGAFEMITKLAAQSAWVSNDGFVAITSYTTDEETGAFTLVTQATADAPVRELTITPEDVAKEVTLLHRWKILWGKLLVQGMEKKRGKPALYVADLPWAGDKPSFTKIADLDWINATIFGCRTGDAMVVGVGRNAGYLLFYEKGRFSSPVPIDTIGGAFGCHQGEAVFTNPFGGQQRCTPAGCRYVDGVAPHFEPFKVRDVYWADLGGKVLAVAATERRGGLRYRWSEGKNLTIEGGDSLLFDDLVKDGAIQGESTALGILLAGRGNFAITLLTTPAGVYALRFDADGKPKPVKLGS